MNPSPAPLAQRLARRLLPQRRRAKTQLPAFSVPAAAIHTLQGPDDFRQTLLQLIGSAQRRIVLVALYLQDDEGGRQVLAALYEAKRARPQLEIEVYVDWHRARRGLIGQQASAGNAALYRSWAEREGAGVAVYGVPVQNRELFGVLHLKGFIVDDTVLYSGASLNDVYLGVGGRYRLDRYHVIAHAPLAESMAALVRSTLQASEAVQRLDRTPLPSTRELQAPIRSFRRDLQQAQYEVPMADGHDGVAVTPLLGFGRSDNRLNEVLLELLHGARQRVVLFTPYFNLPRAVRSTLNGLLRRGVQVDIMVGDKTANDFYIPPSQPFRRIGLLPYLYESNLRRFARSHQGAISRGQLNLWLWRDGDNSYHLKGLLIDRDCAVITGNNLNPRAWALDLENGLLLRDPHEQLLPQHEAEWAQLRSHATRVASYTDLQSARHYPAEVRRLLRRLSRVRLDRLINRLL